MDKKSYWAGYNGALEMVEAYVQAHATFGLGDFIEAKNLLEWMQEKKMVNIEPEKYELVRKDEN